MAVSALPVRPVRHFDGTNYWALAAQARRERIYAVLWSHGKHRIVLTKKEGMRVIKVWKEWHRRQGYHVRGNVATHPTENEMRAVALHEYDALTKKRLA